MVDERERDFGTQHIWLYHMSLVVICACDCDLHSREFVALFIMNLQNARKSILEFGL